MFLEFNINGKIKINFYLLKATFSMNAYELINYKGNKKIREIQDF